MAHNPYYPGDRPEPLGPAAGYASGNLPGDAKILHLASWSKRLVAFAVDVLLLLLVQVALMIAFTPSVEANPDSALAYLPTALGWIAFFLYFWLFTGLNEGRTPGKMALRLETVNEVGGPPTMGQAAVDALGKSLFLVIDVLIGLFVGRDRRQRFSQRLGGLVVVRREPQVEEAGSVRFVKG